MRLMSICLVAALAAPAAAESGTVSGTLVTHAGVGVAGRPVKYAVGTFVPAYDAYGCPVCDYAVIDQSQQAATTDANGNFSFSIAVPPLASCESSPYECDNSGYDYGRCGCGYMSYYYGGGPQVFSEWSVTVTSAGSETTTAWGGAALGQPLTMSTTITGAPSAISPRGMVWARRHGSGSNPVVSFEGFDPGEQFGVGTSSSTRRFMLNTSKLDGSTGLVDYLAANDYTFWDLNTGPFGAATLMGTAQNGFTDGLAYEMVSLTKTVITTFHPGKKAAVGGYSMGGLLAKTGLARWCGGSWADVSNGALAIDCPEVALWWTGDAPLQGGKAPVAMQHYIKDPGLVGMATGLAPFVAIVDSPAAREMLDQYIPGNTCHNNCKDPGGCSSYESDFDDGCSINNYRRAEFVQWQVSAPNSAYDGLPQRRVNGTWSLLPGIAFSNGSDPTRIGNTTRCATSTHLLKNDINNMGDHHLYLNSAGGVEECDAGSQMNTLDAINGMHGDAHACFIFCIDTDWTIYLDRKPVQQLTRSSLNGMVLPAGTYSYVGLPYNAAQVGPIWKDYWFEYDDRPHADASGATPLLTGPAARFLMGYVHEYLKGTKNIPICNTLHGAGKKGLCRGPEIEVCNNGLDDDGDEVVDEAECGGAGQWMLTAAIPLYGSPYRRISSPYGLSCSTDPNSRVCSVWQSAGTTVRITASAPYGYKVTSISGCSTSPVGLGTISAYCDVVMSQNRTVDAYTVQNTPPPSCFVAGTAITMVNGSRRPIEEVKVGDLVAAYDEVTGAMRPGRVSETFVHAAHDGTVLVDGVLRATPNHPIFANGAWVAAEELVAGDAVIGLAAVPMGALVERRALRSILFRPGTETVYNLEVEEVHTYFAEGILVHNKLPAPL